MEAIVPSAKRHSRYVLWGNLVGKDGAFAASEAVRKLESGPRALAAPAVGVETMTTRILHDLDIAHVRVRTVSASRPDELAALLPDDLRRFAEARPDAKLRGNVIWGYGMPFDRLLEFRLGSVMSQRIGPQKMRSLRAHLWRAHREAEVSTSCSDDAVLHHAMSRISSSICALLAASVALHDANVSALGRAASMVERGNLPLCLHQNGTFIVVTA